MQLFVRRSDGSTLSLIQERSASVHDIKSQIESTEGIPSFLQTITFCGSRLDDEQILDSCIDSEIANIELNVDLLGGGKKRKKKVYTTPKKIKRKPKKVKLATLKFYQVHFRIFVVIHIIRLNPMVR